MAASMIQSFRGRLLQEIQWALLTTPCVALSPPLIKQADGPRSTSLRCWRDITAAYLRHLSRRLGRSEVHLASTTRRHRRFLPLPTRFLKIRMVHLAAPPLCTPVCSKTIWVGTHSNSSTSYSSHKSVQQEVAALLRLARLCVSMPTPGTNILK